MTVHAVEIDTPPAHRSFRLTRGSQPRTTSEVRPALVLPEREARALLAAAGRDDVRRGGCWAAGTAGVQLWSGSWDGAAGSHGTAVPLGSVDWSYDTPVRHYVTIYRVVLTGHGAGAGESTDSLLARVLGLVDVQMPAGRLPMQAAPTRDPFRSR